MGLQCLEFAGKHLMVGITADQHDKVELAEDGHFISVQSEPCVHTLLDHPAFRIGAEVFVVEDHIVLDEHVLETTLFVKEIPGLGLISPVTASVIVALGYIQMLPVDSVVLRNLPADKVKKRSEIDLANPCKSLVYLRIISSIDWFSFCGIGNH